jgi:hypothetical protein
MAICEDVREVDVNASIAEIITHIMHGPHNYTTLPRQASINHTNSGVQREESTVTNILLDMFTVLALAMILTNSGLIAVIVSQKAVRLRPLNVLIVGVAVAHVLTGMCTIVYVSYFFNAEDTNPGEPWCRLSDFLINFPLFQARLCLLMVGVERMIHLVRPSCLDVVKRFPVAIAMLVVPCICGVGITLGLRTATGQWVAGGEWCFIARSLVLEVIWGLVNFAIPALLLLLSVAVMTGFLVFTRCSTRVRFPVMQLLEQSSTNAVRETQLTIVAVMSVTILWIILNVPSTIFDAGVIRCNHYGDDIMSCKNLFKLFVQLPFVHAIATPVLFLFCPDVRRPLCGPCRAATSEDPHIDTNESHPLNEIRL